jgi:glycosyltransferase involved in cell wall biosynthesis
MTISALIITRNEAANIRACLDSVRFADQRIVMDSGSTDDTVAIARAVGATVIETKDWPGFGPQRNRALEAAEGDWILFLDADERIPEALQREIQLAVRSADHVAYAIPQLSSFCGYFIRHSGWGPHYPVRLFRRDAGRFSDHLIHETVVSGPGSTGRLRTPLLHYSYRDDSDFLRKLDQYSTLGAEQAHAAGKRGGLTKAVVHALLAAFKSYVLKLGFLDGRAGVMVAISSAESTYHKYLKLMLRSESGPAAG